ncbi:MAG: hypothetical protein AAB856_02975 [Patescibacteria group bacterium]
MHAFLICGQDQNKVGEKAENLLRLKSGEITPKNRIDLRPSAKKDNKLPTLTIEDVRFISNWLSLQSQNQRAVVVHQIQCMTVPAQQAFLKTLEEPGENSYIILTADSETSLLPTILSRCKIIRLPAGIPDPIVDSQRYSVDILQRLIEIGNKSSSEKLIILYELFSEFSGKKFSPSQQGSIPRPDALKFMEYIIDCLHSSLIHKSMTSCLQSACLAHRRLKNNLNVQLALQQFILDIPSN